MVVVRMLFFFVYVCVTHSLVEGLTLLVGIKDKNHGKRNS